MSRRRRRGREAALQLLYASDMENELAKGQNREEFWNLCTAKPEGREFAEKLVNGVLGQLEAIDEKLVVAVENYEFNRIAAVDRNLLRVAVYELLYSDEAPAPVVINEAIEIAKSFGGDQSGKFVNGVLDRIHRESI
ncbi:MAG: N utilization substance protein B [Verrucomicrobiales bacterium]|jgi:N utilization substance protein B